MPVFHTEFLLSPGSLSVAALRPAERLQHCGWVPDVKTSEATAT